MNDERVLHEAGTWSIDDALGVLLAVENRESYGGLAGVRRRGGGEGLMFDVFEYLANARVQRAQSLQGVDARGDILPKEDEVRDAEQGRRDLRAAEAAGRKPWREGVAAWRLRAGRWVRRQRQWRNALRRQFNWPSPGDADGDRRSRGRVVGSTPCWAEPRLCAA